MPKGYWIARVDVHNAEAYKNYAAANGAAFAKFGGRFLVRGGAFDAPVGQPRQRNVVIEFPSLQHALDCYHSEGYQAAAEFRRQAATGEIVVVEGANA